MPFSVKPCVNGLFWFRFVRTPNRGEEVFHPKDVKSLLVAEFRSSRNIIGKKDILKTLEEISKVGKKQYVSESRAETA